MAECYTEMSEESDIEATMSAKSSWNACTVLRILYPRPVSEALTRV